MTSPSRMLDLIFLSSYIITTKFPSSPNGFRLITFPIDCPNSFYPIIRLCLFLREWECRENTNGQNTNNEPAHQLSDSGFFSEYLRSFTVAGPWRSLTALPYSPTPEPFVYSIVIHILYHVARFYANIFFDKKNLTMQNRCGIINVERGYIQKIFSYPPLLRNKKNDTITFTLQLT